MTTQQELASWLTPPKVDVSAPPEIGKQVPAGTRLKVPRSDGKPVIVAFLRHCGCPFAEKTFLRLRDAATSHQDVHFIAVSHSNQEHTTKWQQDIGGTNPPNVEVVVDDQREIYGAWGLGVSSFWHVLSPWGLYDLYRLAKDEGIANRPTASGYRWQTSGTWAVDGKGKIVWGGVAAGANEIPDFGEAVQALGKDGPRPGATRASL